MKSAESTINAERNGVGGAVRPSANLFRWLLGLHALGLSAASFLLVVENAGEEPYLTLIPRQALSQIGGSVTVITLWVYVVAAIGFGVATRRASRWWLLLVPYAALAIYCVHICPMAYLDDLIKFNVIRRGG